MIIIMWQSSKNPNEIIIVGCERFHDDELQFLPNLQATEMKQLKLTDRRLSRALNNNVNLKNSWRISSCYWINWFGWAWALAQRPGMNAKRDHSTKESFPLPIDNHFSFRFGITPYLAIEIIKYVLRAPDSMRKL